MLDRPMTAAPKQVVHADFISLSETAADPEALLAAAAALSRIEGVRQVQAIVGEEGSDFDLALLYLLDDFVALEPFGTDPRYVSFLQAELASALKALAGADVILDGDFATNGERGACLALAAQPETYDWEIKERLVSWLETQAGASGAVGLAAAGERLRYRGLAVAFGGNDWRPERPQIAGMEAVFLTGRARRLG